MNFLYSEYLPHLVIILAAVIFFYLWFEAKYFEWIREHWFLKQTLVSKVSTVLFLVGLILLSLIMLDPREKEIKVKVPVKKSKTIILIDTSTSMLVEDVRPNRLERAALLAKHFARRAASHQISIMIFADITKKLVPFTNDRDLIDARIDSIKEIRNLNAGTSVEKAIAEASRMFNVKDKNVSGNILVITDGEDHGGKVNIDVPDTIKIAFLGVGTPEGGNIPLKDIRGMFYGYKKDRAQTVISKLNRKYFDNAVDSKANRKYFEASITNIPSDDIYTFFSSKEGETSDEENNIRPLGLKRFAYPGLIFIVLSFILRFFPQLSAALFVFTLNSYANDIPDSISKRLELLRNGELSKNEKINLADNLVKHKMTKLANEIYSEQLKDQDVRQHSDSFFNWATSLLEEKNFKDAIQKYQRLEEGTPSNQALVSKIRENIKRAMQLSQSDQNKEKNKSNKEQKKDQDQAQKKNDKNDQKSDEASSGEQSQSGSDSDGDQSNNPFDVKEDKPQEAESNSEQTKPESKKDGEKENEKGSSENEVPQAKKAPVPLLEQLKQDDRKLQIKLLDTSTQGTQDSRKKDW